jgi:hypothetical protein
MYSESFVISAWTVCVATDIARACVCPCILHDSGEDEEVSECKHVPYISIVHHRCCPLSSNIIRLICVCQLSIRRLAAVAEAAAFLSQFHSDNKRPSELRRSHSRDKHNALGPLPPHFNHKSQQNLSL